LLTGLYVKYLDVKHKWLDDTKTTVELVAKLFGGTEVVIAYVHTSDSISEAEQKKEYYLDVMLETIKMGAIKMGVE